MLLDLMAGQIQMSIDNLPLGHAAHPRRQAGGPGRDRRQALAAAARRAHGGRDAAGLLGRVLVQLMAPAGRRRAIINRMSAEVDRMLKKPAILERFKGPGCRAVGGTPAQLGEFIAAEAKKWAEVVQGVRGEGRLNRWPSRILHRELRWDYPPSRTARVAGWSTTSRRYLDAAGDAAVQPGAGHAPARRCGHPRAGGRSWAMRTPAASPAGAAGALADHLVARRASGPVTCAVRLQRRRGRGTAIKLAPACAEITRTASC